ncbi:DUF4397 domain-containing protein [Flavobacterium sp. LS1R49]|uniref:DUF4397 domain-containing protein n=1 Tax=Flavobacterium shii TaxID=2987687 RepID=A0A9X3C4J0_9FLAO|nr:DUF4397 domain-containing protein [Flavobacterium shii]MCV9927899.1 DUF4397 domain-containing protein [Flavobacterium shii]
MKTIKVNKFIHATIMVIAAVVLLSSCDSNNVDLFNTSKLKVVNAAPNSGSQRFIMANIPYISKLSYLDNSVSYHDVSSGSNLVTQYRDQDDNDLYASEKLNLSDNRNYTVYLTGESRDDAKVRLFQDDLSVPASGKAKVKFLHLSAGAPASIDFTDSDGNNITTNLNRFNESGYIEINAGSLSLKAHGTGLTENLATLASSTFDSGKIYSVYIAGSSASGYTIKQISHN